MGVGAWGINDYVNAGHPKLTWAMYVEGRHAQLNTGTAYGMELDMLAYGGHLSPASPYIHFASWGTIGISLASGAGQASIANDATVALAIQNNTAKWLTGIKFDDNAITGADGTGTGGEGEAIALARGHVIQWYVPTGPGAKGPFITSLQVAATLVGITFQDSSVQFSSAGIPTFGIANASPGAAGTVLSVLVNNNGGVNAAVVSLGAADSGGAGFRVMRVPN